MRSRRTDSTSAVAELFRRHADDVYRFIARRAGADRATDLTAEVFRIALVRHEVFDPDRAHARAWLFGIATNVIRDEWRSARRRARAHARAAESTAGAAIDPLLAVDDRLVAADRLHLVREAIDELTADDRDLVTMFAWEECSYGEIAVALDIPVGTVRSRLNRIRRELSGRLNPQEEP